MRKLSLDDIADVRAYEKERQEFRERIITLKRARRVSVGPVVTLVFENRETIRFQIQEMARAEHLTSDEQIENELRVYNPLIPEPGHLSATLFIELTSDAQLRDWLPRLVGLERSVRLRPGATGEAVSCAPDPEHERQLTREEATAAGHNIAFESTPEQVDAFPEGPVSLVIDHPSYTDDTALSERRRHRRVLRPGAPKADD